MTYKQIIAIAAANLNLPEELVDKAYKGYWRFIRLTILNLPLKEVDENEFQSLRTNFNIPSLGKLSCTKDRWLGVLKRYKIINNLRNIDHVKDN